MSELVKRSVFGAIYVALMVWAVMSKGALVFCLVFSFLAFAGIWEYSALVGLHRTRPLRVMLDGFAAVALVVASHLGHTMVILVPYLVYVAYVIIRSLYSERAEQPAGVAKNLFGQVYIALPLALMAAIHSFKIFNFSGGNFLLVLLVCIWANDTGAYLVGSRIGRRPLFPSLSPKKSWEGFFGGMIASMLAAGIMMYIDGSDELHIALAFGAIISVFATWGDLFESMLKRNAGVKDSGSLIPGHGGILDRIDSLLFVGFWASLIAIGYVSYSILSIFKMFM